MLDVKISYADPFETKSIVLGCERRVCHVWNVAKFSGMKNIRLLVSDFPAFQLGGPQDILSGGFASFFGFLLPPSLLNFSRVMPVSSINDMYVSFRHVRRKYFFAKGSPNTIWFISFSTTMNRTFRRTKSFLIFTFRTLLQNFLFRYPSNTTEKIAREIFDFCPQ